MSDELLKQILDKINSIDTRLDNIETDIKDLKQGQQEIKDHLIQLDSQNAERHITAFSKLESVDKEVRFIKHKLHQTEEDVFDIKDHLKLIK
ncbi:hypothetical protein [Tepidibacter formicigenes]|nr:hypothetical protein [Tepidibacter formicigenes]